MMRPWQAIRGFLREEDGATMVEYGLLLAFIAVVVIVAVSAIGRNAKQLFTTVGATI